MRRSIGKQSGESVESVQKKKRNVCVVLSRFSGTRGELVYRGVILHSTLQLYLLLRTKPQTLVGDHSMIDKLICKTS